MNEGDYLLGMMDNAVKSQSTVSFLPNNSIWYPLRTLFLSGTKRFTTHFFHSDLSSGLNKAFSPGRKIKPSLNCIGMVVLPPYVYERIIQRRLSICKTAAKTLTPKRQQLKQQAISLRYDYGWTQDKIADNLHIPQPTINLGLINNTRTRIINNDGHIKHLEGDSFEIIPTLPDKSVGVMSISTLDALYSLRAFLDCVTYPFYPFPTPFECNKGRKFLPLSSIALIGTFVRSVEVTA